MTPSRGLEVNVVPQATLAQSRRLLPQMAMKLVKRLVEAHPDAKAPCVVVAAVSRRACRALGALGGVP